MDIKHVTSAYNAVANIAQNPSADVAESASSEGISPSFWDMISHSLSNAVSDGRKAEEVSTLALMGKADINQLATAVGKAELSLNTVIAVRDKVISAYQQIMQMTI